ncbi:MAG: hypothetical protein LBQ81_09945 [Zoogloeaceae bacterium]|jgi:hypothetical protein|nr:hypothetical protein [Zoogloeaceae bacterium]
MTDLTNLMRQITGKTGYEIDSSYSPKTLPPAKVVPPIPPTQGRSVVRKAQGGDGMSSTLEESSRELYDVVNVFSSEGIFAIAIAPIKTLNFVDGGRIRFNNPFAEEE